MKALGRDGKNRERVKVAVALDSLLQSLVAPRLAEHADAARQLERAREPRYYFAVALAE